MNHFSHCFLNRFSELRTDEAYINSEWENDKAKVLLFSDGKCLVVRDVDGIELAAISASKAERINIETSVKIYLGSDKGVPYFAIEYHSDLLSEIFSNEYEFANLKKLAYQLPKEESSLLSYAKGILYWNQRHKNCSDCGHVTISVEAGHVRKCLSNACGALHFPRTDIAVITLISEGDACLLGRMATWPTGQYATVAGFLEPGETLEQAVAREAMEETGVQLSEITYHSSQPWPFPGSIMVGYMATATSRDLSVNYQELEDARWFTREEIVTGMGDGGGFFLLKSPFHIR